MCISEFPDNRTAMACVMSIVGQGGLATLRTTALLTQEEAGGAMNDAKGVFSPYSTPGATGDDGSTDG
jgi:hypothetical protein